MTVAASTLIAGMPPNFVMGDGMVIIFEPIDPTTGLEVSGVKITHAAVWADVQGTLTNITDVIPQLTPVALTEQAGTAA
jgi:hypothetical protein